MLTTYRLVHVIEENAADIATALVDKIADDPRAAGYLDHVPSPELWKRVHEIYRHLGEWLVNRTPADVEARYLEIGKRRASQKLPLSKLLYAILATRDHLNQYMRLHHPQMEQPSEVMADLEMELLLDQFYNHAIVAAAIGYEQQAEAMRPRPRFGRLLSTTGRKR
ncbi:MAG TPA: hypothetical protein VL382_07910 [Terriglobales bacterium]|nr:hypothetical protein [Terriglobales bacterium]